MFSRFFKRQEPQPDHICDWKVITKTYGAPRREVNVNQLTNEDLIKKILFGVTILHSECVICHLSKIDELIGSDGSKLDDILDVVETNGSPYYLQRSGVTFIINKYQQGMLQVK